MNRASFLFSLLLSFALLACGGGDGRSEGTEVGDCTDRADNDGDGRFDCADEGCSGSPDCTGGVDSGVPLTDASMDGAMVAPDAGVGTTCALPSGVGCGAGTWCFPDLEVSGVGSCQRIGAGGHGAGCTMQADCAESMVCNETGVCRRICTVDAPEVCTPFTADLCFSSGGAARVGYCDQSCTMFGTDPACPAGEWCPAGLCLPTGTGALDAACGPGLPFCAMGLDCRDSVCRPRCESGATAGSAGDTCAGGEVCPFGYCLPACDYDGAGTCPAAGEVCVPEEVAGYGGDYCAPLATDLAHGADCAAAGLMPGSFCGAFRTCLATEPPTCVDLCRPTVQAYGTTSHPDCSDAAATCTDTGFPDIAYGFCASP